MATLSRVEMEAVIASGGSVLYDGHILTRIEQLPSAAALAAGDPAKEAEATADLQAQITELQAQLAQLQPAKPGKKKAAAPDEGDPANTGDTPPST